MIATHPRAVIGTNLGARGRRGPIFSGVDIDVAEGGFGVIVGPGGSGRTSLLLALAGRFRLTSGKLVVGGYTLPRAARQVRHEFAVARARPTVDLDQQLRVRELLAELIGHEGFHERFDQFDRAAELVGLEVGDEDLIAALRPVDQTLLAVALALVPLPHAVAVDDVDLGTTPADLALVWRALRDVSYSGFTVVATSGTPPPADLLDPQRDAVVELAGRPSAATAPAPVTPPAGSPVEPPVEAPTSDQTLELP